MSFVKSKIFKWTASVGITALLLFVLFKQISLVSLSLVLKDLSWSWMLVGLFVYSLSTIIRAYRYRLLGLTSVSVFKLVNVGFVHFFLSGLLPFRSGELSFVYLINKDRKTPIHVNVSALVLARVFDFVAVVGGLLISLAILFPEKIIEFDPIAIGALAVLVLLMIFFVVLLFFSKIIGELIDFLTSFIKNWKPELRSKILLKWKELESALKIIKNPAVFIEALLTSFISWGMLYVLTVVFLQALGHPVNYWQAVFITSFPPIASLIPLGALGNFGTIEAGWVFGLTLIGFNAELAIILSVALHVLTILAQFVASAVSLIFLKTIHK